MGGQAATTGVFLLQLILSTDCLAISPRWSHLRWKTVGPASVAVRSTGSVTLSCSATGSPLPALAWYRDGVFTPHLELGAGEREEKGGGSLGETVAKLRLPCVTPEVAGKYECRARSGHQELSVVTEVTVVPWEGGDLCGEVGAPEVGVHSPTLMVEEGSEARLRCRPMETEKEEGVTTVWRDEEGRAIGKGERHTVTSQGDLIVRDVSFSDMGTYTCTLTNSMGQDSASTFLYPLAPSL